MTHSLGALFQDMGILAMLTMLGSQYATIAADAADNHDNLPKCELDELGFNHTQAGAELEVAAPRLDYRGRQASSLPQYAAVDHRDQTRRAGRMTAAWRSYNPNSTGAVNELTGLALPSGTGIDRKLAI